MEEKVVISLDEYRDLVIAKTKLEQVIEVFQNYDKYDRHNYMNAILGCMGYEEIKKQREEYMLRMAECKEQKDEEE